MRLLNISSGSLYPILMRLENDGFISSKWEEEDPRDLGRPRRRLYRICGKGEKLLREALADLADGLDFTWGSA